MAPAPAAREAQGAPALAPASSVLSLEITSPAIPEMACLRQQRSLTIPVEWPWTPPGTSISQTLAATAPTTSFVRSLPPTLISTPSPASDPPVPPAIAEMVALRPQRNSTVLREWQLITQGTSTSPTLSTMSFVWSRPPTEPTLDSQ